MARWVGAQGQVISAKKACKPPPLWRHRQKTQSFQFFCLIETRLFSRSLEVWTAL